MRLRQALARRIDALTDCLVRLRRVSAAEVLASEILPLLDAAAFLEEHAQSILAPRRPPGRGPLWAGRVRVTVHRRPLGRILILSPGNYPLFLAGVGLLQALAAGNSVLLKPQLGCEEPWPIVLEALAEAGVDLERVQILPSAVESARAAIAEGVDLVVLTGSVETARDVLRQCAATLTPTIMELSGSDAVLVGPGADLDRAARALRWGRELNHGQTCMAPRRLLVDPSCQSLLDRLPHRLLPVDEWPETPGELVAAILPVSEMAAVVDQSPWGLGMSLFGQGEWVEEAVAAVRCGLVVVNDLIAPSADPRVPFGGRKRSGFGTTRGAEGLLAMTAPQSVVERGAGKLYHLEPPSPYDAAILRNAALFEHGSGWQKLRAGLALGRALLAYRLRR